MGLNVYDSQHQWKHVTIRTLEILNYLDYLNYGAQCSWFSKSMDSSYYQDTKNTQLPWLPQLWSTMFMILNINGSVSQSGLWHFIDSALISVLPRLPDKYYLNEPKNDS